MIATICKNTYRFASQTQKLVSLQFNQQRQAAFIKMTNTRKRNTLSLQAIKNLKQTLTRVQKSVHEKKTKIVVLEGEGSVFSSGHDLKQIASSSNPQIIFDECAELMKQIRLFPSPVLCVINGIAAAAGFQMAMACDLIVASQKSKFSCPGVKWGLFCSTPGLELIRNISSPKKANQLLLFGQQFSAKDAYQFGLLNKVVPQQNLSETVNSYIEKSLKLSGQVISFGKKILNEQKQLPIEQAYKLASKAMVENIRKQDCQQGLKAFAQKRHPHFKN